VVEDELNAPLGQNAKAARKRLKIPVSIPQAVAAALGLFILAFAGWTLMVEDPLGGEPFAVTVISQAPGTANQAKPTGGASGDPSQGPRSYDGPDGQPRPDATNLMSPPAGANPKNGTQTVTIIDGSTGKRQEVAIPVSGDPAASRDQRLLERTPHGAIPRIAPDGTRPSEAYAQAVKRKPAQKDRPQIAIVVGGLGISADVTQQAINKLPGPITLGFMPYAQGADGQVKQARAEGHEVLLQVPMEPFDYPDNDPGPQTLLTTVSDSQNRDRLHWLMSRFQGYVGIVNYMGARFTATEEALAHVLKETAKRGLIYVDDGSSPRSLAGQIASTNNLAYAKTEIVLDAVPTPAHIEQALKRLESLAREHGKAVGFASAHPASIEQLAAWAKSLESRGMVLVPISEIALKPKSS
jgi:polysaccharide deacetylase 2 family uncharacterized protein YibQ